MAKILFGIGIADARNKLGGHVFSKNRNGAYVRQKVSPSQPRTPAQLTVRSAFGGFSKAWGASLSDAQRAGWIALAASNTFPDRFGNPQVLTGLQMYQKCNRNLHTISVARLDDPPADLAVDSLASMTITATFTGSILTVGFTVSPLAAGMHLVVFGTPPLSPGKIFATTFMKLVYADPNDLSTSTVDIYADWAALFGPLQAGQKLVFQGMIINDVNGAASQPSSASATIGA